MGQNIPAPCKESPRSVKPSADSDDLFCNHLFEMLDVLAVEVGADPLDEFHFAQGAIRFNDGALGVDPLRLDSIQPRTLDRQSADRDSYSAFTLGLPVMGANPGANFLTDVPTGIAPDQQQRRLARGRELLADPQQEGGRDMADGATIDESDQHLLDVGSPDPVTGDGLRLGVLFGEDHLPKSQRQVTPCSKQTSAAKRSVHRLVSFPNDRGVSCKIARSRSRLASSSIGAAVLGLDERGRKQRVASAQYARIVLGTVGGVHRRWAAIADVRPPRALARRIWHRRNSKASRERRPFSRRRCSSLGK